jgi:hypothetical protein
LSLEGSWLISLEFAEYSILAVGVWSEDYYLGGLSVLMKKSRVDCFFEGWGYLKESLDDEEIPRFIF